MISFVQHPPHIMVWLIACCTILLSGCRVPAPLQRILPTSTPSSSPIQGTNPPNALSCVFHFGQPCFTPQQIQNAYGITPLLNNHIDGTGQTIVIFDSIGSPTIKQDLGTFDRAFNLPDPPAFNIFYPIGNVNYNSHDSSQAGWAGETSLDVEWAHAIAPGASIDLMISPVEETEGTIGMPEFMQLEQMALNEHLGQIFSQSWGASEPTLADSAGQNLRNQFDQVYQQAIAQHVTVFASAGDSGVTNEDEHLHLYNFANLSWPASDPDVTAVGGTQLTLDGNGGSSETVWNTSSGKVNEAHDGAATGGGVSEFYATPNYQKNLSQSMQQELNGKRGIPDISYAANSFLTYISPSTDPLGGGWSVSNGTSAGAPQWAGLTALANQMAGKPIGFLNPLLYKMQENAGINDIVSGNNSFNGVPGYQATAGWDLCSGWGTPSASVFIPLLVQEAKQG